MDAQKTTGDDVVVNEAVQMDEDLSSEVHTKPSQPGTAVPPETEDSTPKCSSVHPGEDMSSNNENPIVPGINDNSCSSGVLNEKKSVQEVQDVMSENEPSIEKKTLTCPSIAPCGIAETESANPKVQVPKVHVVDVGKPSATTERKQADTGNVKDPVRDLSKIPEVSTSAKRKKVRPVKYGRHGKDGEEMIPSVSLLTSSKEAEKKKKQKRVDDKFAPLLLKNEQVRDSSDEETDFSNVEKSDAESWADLDSDEFVDIKEEDDASEAFNLSPRRGGRVRKKPAAFDDMVPRNNTKTNPSKRLKIEEEDIEEEPLDELETQIRDVEMKAKMKKLSTVGCPICQKDFTKTYIRQHILTKHGPQKSAEKPYECFECQRRFLSKGSLKYHMNVHKAEKPFVCDVCGQSFTQKGNMAAHQRIHTRPDGVKDYKCEECGKEFNSKRYWEGHLKFHAGEYNFVCTVCDRAFLQKDGLRSHMKSHTNHKPCVCDICGERLSSIGALKNHKLIHTGEKPFECTICQKCFRDKTTYIRHLTVHSDERPYKCDMCDLSFKWPLYLLRHKVIHTNEKKYPCPDCDKGFKRREHLKLHARTHTGEKPFTCMYCAKRFSQSCSMRQHEKIHAKKNHEKLSPEEFERMSAHYASQQKMHVQVPQNTKVVDGHGNRVKVQGGHGKAQPKTQQVTVDVSYCEDFSDRDGEDNSSDNSDVEKSNFVGVKSDDVGSYPQISIPENASQPFVTPHAGGQSTANRWAVGSAVTNPGQMFVTPQVMNLSQQKWIIDNASSVPLDDVLKTENVVYSEVVIPSNAGEVEIQTTEEIVTQQLQPSPAKVIQIDDVPNFAEEEKLIYLLIDSENGPMPVVLDKNQLQNKGFGTNSDITLVIAGDSNPEASHIVIQQPETQGGTFSPFPETPLEKMLMQANSVVADSHSVPCTIKPVENVARNLTNHPIPSALGKSLEETKAAVAVIESSRSTPGSGTNFQTTSHSAVQVEPVQPVSSPFVIDKSESVETWVAASGKDEIVKEKDAQQLTLRKVLEDTTQVLSPESLINSKPSSLLPLEYMKSSPLRPTTQNVSMSDSVSVPPRDKVATASTGIAQAITFSDASNTISASTSKPIQQEPKVESLDTEKHESVESLEKSKSTVDTEEESKLEAAQSLAWMVNELGSHPVTALSRVPGESDSSEKVDLSNFKQVADDVEDLNEDSRGVPQPGPSRKKSLRSWSEPTGKKRTKTKHTYSEVIDGVDCDLKTGKCFSCFKVFKSSSYLRNHVLIHKGFSTEFRCPECNKVFPSTTNLKTHMALHSPETKNKTFVCPLCSVSLVTKANLKEHMRIHTRKDGEKDFHCEVCGKGFNSRVHFKGHVKMHEGTYHSICPVCGRPFATGHALKTHMKTHSDIKDYICDICGKGVKSNTALRNHKKIHSDDRPHKCSTCGHGFRDRSTMLRHESTHSDKRPYVCDVCGLAFKWKLYMTRHHLVHSNKADYECPTCKRRFKRKEHLKLHVRIHTGEKPYKCRFCDQKFSQTSSCRVHEKTHTEIL